MDKVQPEFTGVPSVPTAFRLTVALEELYFRCALQNLSVANDLRHRLAARYGPLRWLDFYNEMMAYDLGDEIDIPIELVNRVEAVGEHLTTLLGTFIQCLISVPVFGVMALEAHINSVAEQNLSGGEWNLFDRLPLDGKWLFLPGLLGKGTFNVGAEPFQSLKALIGERNKLVHLKKSRRLVQVEGGQVAETFFERSVGDAETAISAVKQLVVNLAALLKMAPPSWAVTGSPQYVTLNPEPREDSEESSRLYDEFR